MTSFFYTSATAAGVVSLSDADQLAALRTKLAPKLLSRDIDFLLSKDITSTTVDLTPTLNELKFHTRERQRLCEILSSYGLGKVDSALNKGFCQMALFWQRCLTVSKRSEQAEGIGDFFVSLCSREGFSGRAVFLFNQREGFELSKKKIREGFNRAFYLYARQGNWDNTRSMGERTDYFTLAQDHVDFWFASACNKRDIAGIESVLADAVAFVPSQIIWNKALSAYGDEKNAPCAHALLDHKKAPPSCRQQALNTYLKLDEIEHVPGLFNAETNFTPLQPDVDAAFLQAVTVENDLVFPLLFNQALRPLSVPVLESALEITPQKPKGLLFDVASKIYYLRSHPMHGRIYERLGRDDPKDWTLRFQRQLQQFARDELPVYNFCDNLQDIRQPILNDGAV